jgi:hypothetical protein
MQEVVVVLTAFATLLPSSITALLPKEEACA